MFGPLLAPIELPRPTGIRSGPGLDYSATQNKSRPQKIRIWAPNLSQMASKLLYTDPPQILHIPALAACQTKLVVQLYGHVILDALCNTGHSGCAG